VVLAPLFIGSISWFLSEKALTPPCSACHVTADDEVSGAIVPATPNAGWFLAPLVGHFRCYMILFTMMFTLVGGFNHLEKYEFVNGKDYPIYEMENKKCSKPPKR